MTAPAVTAPWAWPIDTPLEALRSGFAAHYVRTPDAALFEDASRPIDAAVILLDERAAAVAVDRLQRVTRLLREHFTDLLEHCADTIPFASPELIEALRRQWAQASVGSATHLTTRFDMVPTPTGLRAFEINCGNICGLPGKGSNEAHVEVYGSLVPFRELVEHEGVRVPSTPRAYADYLRHALGAGAAADGGPFVWISDHGDNTEVFARFGIPAVDIRYPRDRARLAADDHGQLLLDGHPVDHAYLDIGADEFFLLAPDDPLVLASRGATTWASSTFESIVLCEKLILAALTDREFVTELVGPDDAAAIAACLVPTELLDARNVDAVISSRGWRVVKPSGLQGGDGVLVGPDVPAHEWEARVRAAAEQRDHVVQPFVAPPQIEVLTEAGGDGQRSRRRAYVNVNPVFVDDAFVDWFGRYSFGRTVTWTRGGSCPVLLADERTGLDRLGSVTTA